MIVRHVLLAGRVLVRNKARAVLTMLGIVIGVGAVIALVAIGRGATGAVQKSIASMGQNQLMINPGSSSSGAMRMGAGTVHTLTPADAAAIERECPSAEEVAIVVRASGQAVAGSVNWSPAEVQGVNPAYFRVRERTVVEGEALSDADVRKAAQVCVIGRTVARELFGDRSPIGQRVRLKGLPLRVVGVLARKGANTFGMDQDDIVLVPWTTAKKKIEGSLFEGVDQLLARARRADLLDPLAREITALLRARHRIRSDGRGGFADDFSVRDMAEIGKAFSATSATMTGLLAAVAAISLLVGGIGIMNIMLVSVTERTREIGIRMAVGARGRDILGQFLVEAMVLSGAGGVVGVALGAGAAWWVGRLFAWTTTVSPGVVALAVVSSSAVGIFFGLYPAWRASRLDPIQALRSE